MVPTNYCNCLCCRGNGNIVSWAPLISNCCSNNASWLLPKPAYSHEQRSMADSMPLPAELHGAVGRATKFTGSWFCGSSYCLQIRVRASWSNMGRSKHSMRSSSGKGLSYRKVKPEQLRTSPTSPAQCLLCKGPAMKGCRLEEFRVL